jgi:hypothetical protein
MGWKVWGTEGTSPNKSWDQFFDCALTCGLLRGDWLHELARRGIREAWRCWSEPLLACGVDWESRGDLTTSMSEDKMDMHDEALYEQEEWLTSGAYVPPLEACRWLTSRHIAGGWKKSAERGGKVGTPR